MFIAALGGLGCSDGPVATAWNGVFEVESLLRDPGCEVPTTETEPPLPFVGLGYGADVGIDLEVLTVFWCETPTQCITLPQANAWLDVATEEQVSGSFGEAELVAANVCAGLYNAIEATQTPNGRLTLDIVLANPEPVTVADEDECVAFLEDIAANQCDERLLIEARRAD
ncbi:MAG: hypothetical protein AAF211_02020 [Myxococcota bacterium]